VSNKVEDLKRQLNERILVLDGGMGTMIQSYRLEEEDFRGERFADWPCYLKGNNDLLVLTKPETIAAIHSAYFDQESYRNPARKNKASAMADTDCPPCEGCLSSLAGRHNDVIDTRPTAGNRYRSIGEVRER